MWDEFPFFHCKFSQFSLIGAPQISVIGAPHFSFIGASHFSLISAPHFSLMCTPQISLIGALQYPIFHIKAHTNFKFRCTGFPFGIILSSRATSCPTFRLPGIGAHLFFLYFSNRYRVFTYINLPSGVIVAL